MIVAAITLATLHMWRPSSRVRSRSSVKIGSGSTIKSGIAGRDLNQGLINPEKPEVADSNSESSVEIGRSVSISGSVAGRDIFINQDRLPDKTEELAKILEYRAVRIKTELAQHFQYTPVQEFLNRFDQLHIRHVDALRQGNIVYAHEILREIHELSYNLQSEEFWTRNHLESPGTNYELSSEAFQRGYLIEWYVGSEVMEKLVEAKMKTRWTYEDNQESSNPQKNASKVYSMISKLTK